MHLCPADALAHRFNHAPWESLRRQNVIVWLSWSCFNLPYEQVQTNEKWHDFLISSLEMLEARTGTTFPEGFDPSIEMLRLTLDPVNVSHRSFVFTLGYVLSLGPALILLLGKGSTAHPVRRDQRHQLVAP